MDIIHQIVQLLCVLCVVQELRDIFLAYHWVQGFADIIQFPSDLRPSVSVPDIGEGRVTVPAFFFSLSP